MKWLRQKNLSTKQDLKQHERQLSSNLPHTTAPKSCLMATEPAEHPLAGRDANGTQLGTLSHSPLAHWKIGAGRVMFFEKMPLMQLTSALMPSGPLDKGKT